MTEKGLDGSSDALRNPNLSQVGWTGRSRTAPHGAFTSLSERSFPCNIVHLGRGSKMRQMRQYKRKVRVLF